MKTILLLTAFAFASSTAFAQTTPTSNPVSGTPSTTPATNGTQIAADHTGSPVGIIDANNANDAAANQARNRTPKRDRVKTTTHKVKTKM